MNLLEAFVLYSKLTNNNIHVIFMIDGQRITSSMNELNKLQKLKKKLAIIKPFFSTPACLRCRRNHALTVSSVLAGQ